MIIQLADYINQRELIAIRNKKNLINQMIAYSLKKYGIANYLTIYRVVEEMRSKGILNSMYNLRKKGKN